MAEEKNKTEDIMKEINKKYQSDSLVFGNEIAKIETIDTNCFSLNSIFGCGGIPKGRLIEISGSPSTGKTALALFLVAQIQKIGGKVLWVDAERVFNPVYTQKIGVNIEKLVVSTPESGEESLDIVEKMVATGEYAMVVVDSVAALVPQKELDSEPTDVTIALIAKMMSRHLRVVTAIAARTKTIIIYINQIRDNLQMGYGYGKKTVTTGGKALPFYASVRIEVKAIGKIKDKNEQVIGNRLKIYAEKNKCGLPFKSAEIDLYFNSGIDIIGDLLDIAVQQGIIIRTGNSYAYNGNKFATNRDMAKEYLEKDVKMFNEIKNKINEK